MASANQEAMHDREKHQMDDDREAGRDGSLIARRVQTWRLRTHQMKGNDMAQRANERQMAARAKAMNPNGEAGVSDSLDGLNHQRRMTTGRSAIIHRSKHDRAHAGSRPPEYHVLPFQCQTTERKY